MAVTENGGRLGGREVEYVAVDDESNPAKGPENTNRLVSADKVDVIIGPVHSGVGMAMSKVVTEIGTLAIVANAGADGITGPMCAPNVFRTSFSNWQTSAPMGKVAYDRGMRRVVTISWKYTAGSEQLGGFEEFFTKQGGTIVKQILVPFPSAEFQAYLTEIAGLKPDGVFCFFAGAGALQFVRDYAAAGLSRIPLMGSGFLTDGVLSGQGAAADGLLTTLHYADALDTPENRKFRAAFKTFSGKEADVYSVQGYDSAQLLLQGLAAVKGDTSSGSRAALIAAMEKAEIKSPRGPFTLSKAHNPVQNIYLRQVKGGQEVVLDVAAKALADPARGCKAS